LVGIFFAFSDMQIILLNLNPSRSRLSQHHDSLAGIDRTTVHWIVCGAILFGLYITWRVWRLLRAERKIKLHVKSQPNQTPPKKNPLTIKDRRRKRIQKKNHAK